MEKMQQTAGVAPREENVVAGIVGAFLFSLVGGIVWVLLWQINLIAGLSGIIGVVCAIKGYAWFGKKESVKGVIISFVLALLVLVLAWYLCLSQDVYLAYQDWYAIGEIDFTLTYAESVQVAWMFLEDPEVLLGYLGDLGFGVLFCILGSISSVRNAVKRAKEEKKNAAAGSAEELLPTEEIIPGLADDVVEAKVIEDSNVNDVPEETD